jgi:hypothetical protein
MYRNQWQLSVCRAYKRIDQQESPLVKVLLSYAKRSVLLLSSFMGLSKTLEDLMRNQPLFQVINHHGEACGIPPQIDEQTFPDVYRSYFENQNGEQAIFLYDYEQERGTLYLGDEGWEHPYDVVDGKVPELILNHPEQLWLSACGEASGALTAVREQIREERRRKRQ